MKEKAKSSHRSLKVFVIILAIIVGLVAICYFVPFGFMMSGLKGEVQGDPQVMLIFGYQLDDDGMAPLLKSRLDTAIAYINQHPDVTVIVSGGNGKGAFESEADCMRQYLVQQGISEGSVIVEDQAATTVENIKFALALISEKNIDISGGILMVSNDFHLARIRMLAKRAGISVPVSTLAAPSEPNNLKILMRLREPFAMLMDFITAKY